MEKETEQKDELEMISGAATSGVRILSPFEKMTPFQTDSNVAWVVGTVPLIGASD
jgi:hypothetical protein